MWTVVAIHSIPFAATHLKRSSGMSITHRGRLALHLQPLHRLSTLYWWTQPSNFFVLIYTHHALDNLLVQLSRPIFQFLEQFQYATTIDYTLLFTTSSFYGSLDQPLIRTLPECHRRSNLYSHILTILQDWKYSCHPLVNNMVVLMQSYKFVFV